MGFPRDRYTTLPETDDRIMATMVTATWRYGRTAEDSPAVLVRSHGPFAWGRTAAAAVESAVALEAIATIAWRTLGIDPAAPAIQAELLRRHFDRKHGATAYYGQPTGEEAGRR